MINFDITQIDCIEIDDAKNDRIKILLIRLQRWVPRQLGGEE